MIPKEMENPQIITYLKPSSKVTKAAKATKIDPLHKNFKVRPVFSWTAENTNLKIVIAVENIETQYAAYYLLAISSMTMKEGNQERKDCMTPAYNMNIKQK